MTLSVLPESTGEGFLEDLVSHQSLQSRSETLTNVFRFSQKAVERELQTVVEMTKQLRNNKHSRSRADTAKALRAILSRLKALKVKFQAEAEKEKHWAGLLLEGVGELEASKRRRINDADDDVEPKSPPPSDGCLPPDAQVSEKGLTTPPRAKDPRGRLQVLTNVIVEEYLLREGFLATARVVAEKRSSRTAFAPDTELYKARLSVLDSLRNDNFKATLKWCAVNKSKLKKLNSSCEFKLREREFYTFVTQGKLVEAITYAKHHFPSLCDADPECRVPDIKTAMGVLAFDNAKRQKVQHYDEAFKNMGGGLDAISKLFTRETLRVNGLNPHALLPTLVFSGLSCLSTKRLGKFRDPTNCPCCSPYLEPVCHRVPFAQISQSTLICPVTKSIISENNPAMVLPDRSIISRAALKQLSTDDGKMVRSPQETPPSRIYDATLIRRAYLV